MILGGTHSKRLHDLASSSFLHFRLVASTAVGRRGGTHVFLPNTPLQRRSNAPFEKVVVKSQLRSSLTKQHGRYWKVKHSEGWTPPRGGHLYQR